MNIDNMIIGELKEIKAFLQMPVHEHNNNDAHPYIGKRVIIRTYESGVHLATLKSYDAETRDAMLMDAQRIYRWEGAFTLSKVATCGITGGRISCAVPEMFVNQVIELIPVSEIAEQSIKKIGVHNE